MIKVKIFTLLRIYLGIDEIDIEADKIDIRTLLNRICEKIDNNLIIDKLIDKGDTIESVLSEEEKENVKSIFEKAINNTNATVSVESMSPDELPVIITLSEFMRRYKDMAKTGGGGMMMMGDMPDNLSVAVNGNHKLVKKITETKKDKDKEQLAKQACDLALLSQGLLTGEALTSFIERSAKMIS